MLLKRLQPSLSSDLHYLLPLLEKEGIKTSESLLWTPTSYLHDVLPKESTALEGLIQECLVLTAPPEVLGDEALDDELQIQEGAGWAGFGLHGLDDILADWDGRGVIEICGVNRVGKSLLALHAALHMLKADVTARCRWLDASGSFQPTRAAAILENWGEDDPVAILDRLVISPCFRTNPDLYEALGAIRQELSENGEGSSTTNMLVIDPMFNLFKDNLHSTSSQGTSHTPEGLKAGHAEMIAALEDISELTHSLGLTTIITNGVASHVGKTKNEMSVFSTTTIKPALGVSFSFFADITLLVQETGKVFGMADEGERERVREKPGLRGVVEVIKSRFTPVGDWTVFETDGIRLQDVLPPPTEDERTIRMSAGLPVGPVRPLHGPLAQTVIP